MSKTKDVQEQVEDILQEQISLLRIRAKECTRQFNHQRYDELTAQYLALESKLKSLIVSGSERVVTKSPVLGAPYETEKENGINGEPDTENKLSDPPVRLRSAIEMGLSETDIYSQYDAPRVPETTNSGLSNDGGAGTSFNWTRLRQYNP
jgi:hypothetical protein